MTAENKGQYIAGGALVLAVAAFILIVFSLLGRTDRTSLYLTDTSDERFGWRYELLVNGHGQEFEPVFADYDLTLPEGTEAVRISRVMTEVVPYAQLQWTCDGDGVEVFLDGDLLYSDFQQARRDDAGFVHPDREEWDRLRRNQGDLWRQVQVMLPSEYVGKELSMVTYFPPGESAPAPEYPLLLNEEAVVADPVVFSVRYNAIMTIYAILALGIACVFLLDIHNGNMDGRTLLLCLYFLLLFLNEAYYSFAGYYSVLTERLDLRFLNTLYIAPLYLYLTLRTMTRWKWPLCGGILAWSLYEGVREFLRIHRGMVGDADSVGSGALAVFLAVAIALCAEWLRTGRRTGQDRRSFATYGLAAAGVSAAYLIGRVRPGAACAVTWRTGYGWPSAWGTSGPW